LLLRYRPGVLNPREKEASMSKRPAPQVTMPVAKAAAAFGLTTAATRAFARAAGMRGDEIEIGNLAAHIARATIGSQYHAEAA
jgi:hypothetical protein